MIVYGWPELNECCFGIQKETFPDNGNTMEEHLYQNNMDGEWFRTFAEAKRFYLETLTSQKSWIISALRQARKLRKKDLE